ncbi:MAG: hypothetical protein ACJ74Z_13965 [Bryobacteraceae bacterium]
MAWLGGFGRTDCACEWDGEAGCPLRRVGHLASPIATKNSEAQKYFNQGLTLTWSFNRYEALRSFRRASELDPHAVMPYWGMAIAQGPYINMDGDPSFDPKGTCAAVQAGSRVRDGAPEIERDYLTFCTSTLGSTTAIP